jgi:hypothetical protein
MPAETARRAGLVFTTRKGGVSEGPFSALNLSPHVGDDVEAVTANRRRVARALGAPGRSMVSLLQVHGTRVVEFPEADREGGRAQADGVIVRPHRDRGVAVALLYADCVPVVLVGEEDVAILHCGWKGLLAGVIASGARALAERPRMAFIGPSIGPCCYEVGSELAAAFSERFGPDVVGEGPRLDLWASASRALEEAGLERGSVVNGRLCSHCLPDLFYSHRREGPATGRHGAVVYTHGGERVEQAPRDGWS